MKITILNVPSSPHADPPYGIEVDDESNPAELEITEHCDDGSTERWQISREDFDQLEYQEYPQPIAVPMVADPHAEDGHRWLANGRYIGIWTLVHGEPFQDL